MQINDFIESRDIADYWEKIGYKPSPIECAYLVWQSHLQPVDKKIAAWEEILQNFTDCALLSSDSPMRSSFPKKYADSLHAFLRAYIAMHKQILAEFYRSEDDAAYYDSDGNLDFGPYHTASECIGCALQWISPPHCTRAAASKSWFGGGKRITFFIRADGVVMEINAVGLSEREEKLLDAFSDMHFDFPVPFRKGDIVASKYSPYAWDEGNEVPFVLHRIAGTQDGDPHADLDNLFCMGAYGYFCDFHGGAQYDQIENYLALEYYRGELTTTRQILQMYSDYEKGKIDKAALSEIERSIKDGKNRLE